jgi:hypothetical protein
MEALLTDITMRPEEAIKELKALKLHCKDSLAWIQSPQCNMSLETRADMAVRFQRRAAALKLCIHAMEEANVHFRTRRVAA